MQAKALHPIQEAILRLSREQNIATLKLREIGRMIGHPAPQKIKHHLEQLEKRGILKIDRERKVTERVSNGWIDGFLEKGRKLFRIPIVGAANCGPATLLAEQNVVGYLRISSTLLNRKSSDGLFAVRADGFSMNQAVVNGKNIDNGDFLIINSRAKLPKEGQVILSIIDGAANIKRFHLDKENNQIVLISDSTQDFAPIHIHPDDDFCVNGRVIDVVKKPKNKTSQ